MSASDQRFKRLLWEQTYTKIQFESMQDFEVGLSEINRLVAKYGCANLTLDRSTIPAFQIAELIYEEAKLRQSVYNQLQLALYPDNLSGILATLSYKLKHKTIQLDVLQIGSDDFTIAVKSLDHKNSSSTPEKYSIPILLEKHALISKANLGSKLLDVLANTLRG